MALSLRQLRADLRAANQEVRGLMDGREALKEQHRHVVAEARDGEREKIASLAGMLEALARLVRISHS